MFPDLNSRSAELFNRAQLVMPGGNSRHSVAVAPYPIYAASGRGCHVTDCDGQTYIDCINNMSANIHGHAHPAIVEAVVKQMERLISVGLPTEVEIQLAEMMTARVASIDTIRFANSGTEALMFAVRAARAFTGRRKIAKVEGGYHGSYDGLDVSNRPTPDVWGDAEMPSTAMEGEGLTPGSIADTVVFPVNRCDAAHRLFELHGDELAAIVIDPLVSRMGFLPLNDDFLTLVRDETRKRGIVLILDEVFSFRLGVQGAQGEFNIQPDLSTFGKLIGGGFPIGAVGGRADIMSVFSHLPHGNPRVEHSGTFNANPVSMAAGIAALNLLDEAAFVRLNRLGNRLRQGFSDILAELNIPGYPQGRGSLTALLPFAHRFQDYREFAIEFARSGAGPKMAMLHRTMINHGVLPVFPSGFILSTPMDEATIDQILEAMRASLAALPGKLAAA